MNPLIQKTDDLGSTTYNGYSYGLGVTLSHYQKKPVINPYNGKKVLAIIGASNSAQEGLAFINYCNLMRSNIDKDTKIVNLAIPAKDVNRWKNPNDTIWNSVTQMLSTAGLTYWDIQAIAFETDDLRDRDNTFPDAPSRLADKILEAVRVFKLKFPNLKQCELISRAHTELVGSSEAKHAEPAGWHNGWSCKWAVERAIANPSLASGVWLSDILGFYTDGDKMRVDGFVQPDNCFEPDGVHPSEEGEESRAHLMFQYYLNYDWFARNTMTTLRYVIENFIS